MTNFTVRFRECPLSEDMLVLIIGAALQDATSYVSDPDFRQRLLEARTMAYSWYLTSKTKTFPDGHFNVGDRVRLVHYSSTYVIRRFDSYRGYVILDNGNTYRPHSILPEDKMYAHNDPDLPPEDVVLDGFPISKRELLQVLAQSVSNSLLDIIGFARQFEHNGEVINVHDTVRGWIRSELEKVIPIGSIWQRDENDNDIITVASAPREDFTFNVIDNITGNEVVFMLSLSYRMIWHGGND